MPSQKKFEYVERVKECLKPGKAFYFTDFTGLTVKNLQVLRHELRKNKATYVVLKNTLGFLALKEMGFDEPSIRQLFVGPTGVAIAFDDPVVLAKILHDTEKLKVKGGFVEGEYFDSSKIIEFSKIPPRDVLYGHIVGSINVIANFVGTLESIIRDLMYTLEAMKDKNKEVK
jgi:large subunit ribosomal protein L10